MIGLKNKSLPKNERIILLKKTINMLKNKCIPLNEGELKWLEEIEEELKLLEEE